MSHTKISYLGISTTFLTFIEHNNYIIQSMDMKAYQIGSFWLLDLCQSFCSSNEAFFPILFSHSYL